MTRRSTYGLFALVAVMALLAAAVCLGCVEFACDHHVGTTSIQTPSAAEFARLTAVAVQVLAPSLVGLLLVSTLIVAAGSRRDLQRVPLAVPLRA